MNMYFVTLLFPMIAVIFAVRWFRRSENVVANVPLQFSLQDLLLLTFGAGIWFAIEPPNENVYYAVCRVILCFCALLASQDIAGQFVTPRTVLRKALIFAPICVAFAATSGLALIFWWIYLLSRKSKGSLCRSGARIAVIAAGVYGVAFLLPLEIKRPVTSFDTLWGFSCYVGSLAESVNALHSRIEGGGQRSYFSNESYLIPWSANVLLWIAWIYAARGQTSAAVFASLSGFIFSAAFYFVSGVDWVFFPAYHTWIFSMFLTAVLALIALIRKTECAVKTSQ